MWERNPAYKIDKCLVCGRRTRDMAAPMGIASGSFPVCIDHEDAEVMQAYFDWCNARWTHSERSG